MYWATFLNLVFLKHVRKFYFFRLIQIFKDFMFMEGNKDY